MEASKKTHHDSPLAQRPGLHLVHSVCGVVQVGEVDQCAVLLAIHEGVRHLPELLEHPVDVLLMQVLSGTVDPHAVGGHALAKPQLQKKK